MCVSAGAAATISLIAGGVGAATSVAGGIYQGYASEKAARYNERIAKRNRELAQQQADEAKRRGRIQESRYRQQVRSLVGKQRAGAAAAGVLAGEGSPSDIVADTISLGNIDAMEIQRQAEFEAAGYGIQAQNYGNQASMYRGMQTQAWAGAGLGAGGSFLTGLGSLAGAYSKFSKLGVWGNTNA